MARLVASTQGSFHSRLTWDSRLEAHALHCSNAHVCNCVSLCTWCTRARLWATSTSLSKRQLPGAPCGVPRHQLHQNLSPSPLCWKLCGLPCGVSNTTPTYLRTFWRCAQLSSAISGEKHNYNVGPLKKGMIDQLLCPFIICVGSI